MKNRIRRIRIIGNVAIVTASAEYDPLHSLEDLAHEFRDAGFSGSVLFDLLAINGLADNRFVSVSFDGRNFERATFALEQQVAPDLRRYQDTAAKGDLEFLRSTVLSSSEIEDFVSHH